MDLDDLYKEIELLDNPQEMKVTIQDIEPLSDTEFNIIIKVGKKNIFWNSRGSGRMTIDEFVNAINEKDFSIGDSFWINDIEFQVIRKR